MWHLLIHSDQDVRDFAGDAVLSATAAVPITSNPIKVGNLAEAEQNLAAWKLQCDLVVVEETAPATRKASVGGSTRQPVFDFIRRIKKDQPALPVIVLAASADEVLRTFLTAFEATAHVELVPDWRETLYSRAEELLKNMPPPSGQTRLELDITLAGNQRTNWQIRRTGDSSFSDFGELHVDADELKRLVRRSKGLASYVGRADWQNELSDISIDLARLLFDNAHLNRKLWRKFVDHRAQVGGVENTRVRVTLNDDTHPVMIEALKDDEESAFWMLRAPIFRRYECPMARAPLFKDRASRHGPINFLVIQADPAPGNIPDGPWAGSLAPLPEIEAETSDLVAAFERVCDAAGGGVADRLSIAALAGDPVGAVIAKLRERHWHIVHFAGHGLVSGANDAALVLAPERGGVLRVTDLADKLVGTQFLFLNSCRSADSYFVMRAVENFVPAVLGFRWAVPDASGANFARAFYEALFARGQPSYKYVEYAFMSARRAIHDRDSGDPTWASPVLVMQLP